MSTKIRRDQLKAIIKECLLELAADGTLTEALHRPSTAASNHGSNIVESLLAETAAGVRDQESQVVEVPPAAPLQPIGNATQQQSPAGVWAKLAFNSPIKNRPGASGGGFLPGQNMGRFG